MKELRRFEAVDIEELLSRISEKIIRKNQEYLQMDMETFREAAIKDKPSYFLWLAHPEGTWCLDEKETYIKGTPANYIWNSYKRTNRPVEAVAITVYALQDDRIIGDIYELNHEEHCKEMQEKSFPALTAEIHLYEKEEKKKICIPMSQYEIKDYWNTSVTEINFTAENEKSLTQTIRWIRQHRKQASVRGIEDTYIKELEKKAFTKYLRNYDKKKNRKQIEEIKSGKYERFMQEGYVFINLEEAEFAKKIKVSLNGIDREGNIVPIYGKSDMEIYWREGGYFCMEKEWREFLEYVQTRPELPYTEKQLKKIYTRAQVSYDTSPEIKKHTLGKIIAKINVLLYAYYNIEDQLTFRPDKSIGNSSERHVHPLITEPADQYPLRNNGAGTTFSQEESRTINELMEYCGNTKELMVDIVAEAQHAGR